MPYMQTTTGAPIGAPVVGLGFAVLGLREVRADHAPEAAVGLDGGEADVAVVLAVVAGAVHAPGIAEHQRPFAVGVGLHRDHRVGVAANDRRAAGGFVDRHGHGLAGLELLVDLVEQVIAAGHI